MAEMAVVPVPSEGLFVSITRSVEFAPPILDDREDGDNLDTETKSQRSKTPEIDELIGEQIDEIPTSVKSWRSSLSSIQARRKSELEGAELASRDRTMPKRKDKKIDSLKEYKSRRSQLGVPSSVAGTRSSVAGTRSSVNAQHVRVSLRPSCVMNRATSKDSPAEFHSDAAEIKEGVELEVEDSRCLIWRRNLAVHCRQITKNRSFQTGMFVALLCALFLPDLWIIFDRSTNDDLDVILTIVFFAFLFELMVQAIGQAKTYFGSFFFWMDLLGAASLLFDLTYISFFDVLTSGDDNLSNNVVVMRAARIAKLGARAGRFSRLVKLLRFLPGMREQVADANVAKVISARLINAVSMRVSCLIILIVMIMPIFSMWSFPEQDWSMQTWLEIIDKTAMSHPDLLESNLEAFEAFYEDMDHYPSKLIAKDLISLPAVARSLLPWSSLRGSAKRSANIMRQVSEHFICEYSFKKPNQIDAIMNSLVLVFVMLLMACFSLALSRSISVICLKPLEKLLMHVREMSSTIFTTVTDMTVTIREEAADDVIVDEGDAEEIEGEKGASLENETEQLQKVVKRLDVLSSITLAKAATESAQEGIEENDRAIFNESGVLARLSTPGSKDSAGYQVNVRECDSEGVIEAQLAMLEDVGLEISLLDSWNFNPLELDNSRNHAAVMYFVGPSNHEVSFERRTMENFLEAAESGYEKTCSYHNWFHAIDVTHAVYRLLQTCQAASYLSALERYGLLVSCTVHDIGHPGLNNSFLVETSHELAMRYNDKSPLENMHCAMMFEFISDPDCNVFASLSKLHFQEIRRLCIEVILHTDNAQHFAMIKEVQMLYECNSDILDAAREAYQEAPNEIASVETIECYKQSESRRLLAKLFLHVADISNSTKPFRISRVWALQVLDEFFVQGDAEKRLGVPVQALNDRTKINRPFSQIGFIEFLVSPLLFAVVKVLPATRPLLDQLIRNAKSWQNLWLSETKPTPSDKEKKALAERVAKLGQKYSETHGFLKRITSSRSPREYT